MKGKFSCLLISVVALATSIVMTGCAGTPKQSGFLATYSDMIGKYDLDQVRISSGASFAPYDTLIMTPVDTSRLGVDDIQEDEDRKNVLNKLEENFRVAIAPYFKTILSNGSGAEDATYAVRLEWAVTELRPTDVVKNLVWGFGVGNATGAIEGRFVDVKTGQELVAFVDRKKGSPFTKKEYNQQMKFPNWSKLRYLYIFTEIWAENTGNLVKALKK